MSTRWRPDTCECVIDVDDWDAKVGTTIVACVFHQGLLDNAHLGAVLTENQSKNIAYGAALRSIDSLTKIETPEKVESVLTVDDKGTPTVIKRIIPAVKVLRDDVAFTYAFDDQRQLHISFVGATKAEQVDIEAAVAAALPAVKVVDATDVVAALDSVAVEIP